MRKFAGAAAININIDGNKLIDDVASFLSSTVGGLLGDKDKTCWGTDDLLFYEGRYCTQNTVGSIPTWTWNGDYNNGLCVILFLKQICILIYNAYNKYFRIFEIA